MIDKETARELEAALRQLVAWKTAIQFAAPDLGGLLLAIYHAEAILNKLDQKP